MKEKKEMKVKVYLPDGTLAGISEIIEFMISRRALIEQMRRSPYFHKQLQSGDLSDYNKQIENLKFRDENGNTIEDDEVINLIKEMEEEEEER